MTVDEACLKSLRPACSGEPQVFSENGLDLILLPNLTLTVSGQTRRMDALLCPGPHAGYSTRLFLAAAIPEKPLNWQTAVILGKTWHTWSWQGVPANLPLMTILVGHLAALR